MGYAAVRDIVSFLRRDTTPANPLLNGLHPSVSRAIGFGVSQSGRFLRDFLYLGFNEDTHGRVVFDGLMPHVSGTRRMATNVRFGEPGRNPRHPQDPAWQADLFPFTYATLSDPLSGKTDGLLRRCALSATCPKIMQTDSEHEWWASHASLLVTDLAGNHLDLPDNVRAYMIAGTPHFAEPNDHMRKGVPAMALPQNPMHAGAPMRALLSDLNAWIRDGVLPPASRVPMRAHGTLVPAESAVRTDIPGLPYKGIHTLSVFSDQSVLPPKEIGRYPVFVPKADADGMAIAGVHMLALAVPRATYTGWNPRAHGFGPTAFYPLQGAVIPFAPTEAARKDVNDPRPRSQTRYADDDAYVAAVRKEAARQWPNACSCLTTTSFASASGTSVTSPTTNSTRPTTASSSATSGRTCWRRLPFEGTADRPHPALALVRRPDERRRAVAHRHMKSFSTSRTRTGQGPQAHRDPVLPAGSAATTSTASDA